MGFGALRAPVLFRLNNARRRFAAPCSDHMKNTRNKSLLGEIPECVTVSLSSTIQMQVALCNVHVSLVKGTQV